MGSLISGILGANGPKWLPVAIPVVVAIAIVAGALAVAFSGSPFGSRQIPVFENGEIIRMKAFGHEGMVVASRCPPSFKGKVYPCTYSVRFSALQARTDVALFGRDGPIDVAPIALVHGIEEFEIERAGR